MPDTDDGDPHTVRICGSITSHGILRTAAAGRSRIRFDLTRVRFISDELVADLLTLRRRGWKITLRLAKGSQPHRCLEVKRLFELSGFTRELVEMPPVEQKRRLGIFLRQPELPCS